MLIYYHNNNIELFCGEQIINNKRGFNPFKWRTIKRIRAGLERDLCESKLTIFFLQFEYEESMSMSEMIY